MKTAYRRKYIPKAAALFVLLLTATVLVSCADRGKPVEVTGEVGFTPAASVSEEAEVPEPSELSADTEQTEPVEKPEELVSETPASESPEPEDPSSEPAEEPAEEKKLPKMLFQDTFDGDKLDSTRWERCPEWDRQGTLDRWSDEHSFLDGEGHLVLRAEWDDENEQVLSGAVRTNGKFTCGYGYYEASIRFPVAKGTWGAFWMMVGNVGSEKNGAVDGVEIDIVESIWNEQATCNQALHWDGYGNAHKSASNTIKKTNIYDGNFHTFGLWRTPDEYLFYIDGAEVWRTAEGGICPEQGYMKLTVEAADWAGAGQKDAVSALPADMLVDYVRVYDTKPY